ncbi:Dabb family protein [Microbacterium sp. X-17]|uniref:Dabb family protein n=1 Tax=Microbacterium sp. X-17 TaxID=3144404 RepID=UPI0031F5B825
MAYRHIVLFRVHEDVAEAAVARAIEELRALGRLPGVTSWNVELSLDDRKGRVIVEDATFEDADAYRSFAENSGHRRAGELLREISDWWVGDYATPS